MFQDVFDDVERSAMGRAIDQIMQSAGEEARLRRLEVANTVIVVACESHEFGPSKLASGIGSGAIRARHDERASFGEAAVNEIALTPLQLRAARNLLSWSRYRLAARMGISAEPIARFENEGWFSRAFDAQKARKILEAAGVEFFVVNGGDAMPFVSNLPPTKRGRGRPSKVSAKSIRSDQNEPDLFAGWISEEAFARQRGLSIDNLRAERRCADGPPFTRDGRKIFYNGQRFREWLARQGAAVERGGELP